MMYKRLPLNEANNLLSKGSLARIEAAKAEAAAELLIDLSRCLESVAVTAESLIAHDPSELIPFFERYAERQYDSFAEELLPHFADVEEYTWHLTFSVAADILMEIMPQRGFMPSKKYSGEWRELVRMLNADPALAEQWRKDISDTSGDWEDYLDQAFKRHVSKTRGRFRRWDDAKATEAERVCRTVFQLKYQAHMRLYTTRCDVDERLQAHLSNRLAYWEGRARRQAATKQTEQAALTGLGVSEEPGSQAEPMEGASSQTADYPKSDWNPAARRVPSVTDIKAALDIEDRKNAVRLRCSLDRCTITQLWLGAFKLRRAADTTKRTAFNRWQASRRDAPSWTDELMRKHLLR